MVTGKCDGGRGAPLICSSIQRLNEIQFRYKYAPYWRNYQISQVFKFMISSLVAPIPETNQKAIQNKVVISFEYKSTKISGCRIGNPHAIYIYRKKDGTESTKVDIEQTDGVSDSQKPFPSFRMFDLEKISKVVILEPSRTFQESVDYKAESDRYKSVIAKV